MRMAWLVAVFAVWLASADRVLACGAEVAPYLTIESVSPPEGVTGVVRDGAITIAFRLWPGIGGSSQYSVHVSRHDDDAEVLGVLDPSTPYARFVHWRPLQPLAANTSYRVAVDVQSTPELPSQITGLQSLSSTFTTSNELAPALELIGDLEIQLHASSAAITRCDDPCGYDCKVVSARPALYARVTEPQVRGGFDWFGYSKWVQISDREPVSYDRPGEGKRSSVSTFSPGYYIDSETSPSRWSTIEIPRPEGGQADICLAFNAWDAAGHWRSAKPVCVEASKVEAAFGKLDAPENTPERTVPSSETDDAGVVRDQPPLDNDAGQSYSAETPEHSMPAVFSCSAATRHGPNERWLSLAMLPVMLLWRRMARRKATPAVVR